MYKYMYLCTRQTLQIDRCKFEFKGQSGPIKYDSPMLLTATKTRGIFFCCLCSTST